MSNDWNTIIARKADEQGLDNPYDTLDALMEELPELNNNIDAASQALHEAEAAMQDHGHKIEAAKSAIHSAIRDEVRATAENR